MNFFSEFIETFLPYVICALTGAVGAWWVQGMRLDVARAEHDKYVIQAQANAAEADRLRLETETRWKQEAENAQTESRKRLETMEAERAALAAAAGRLRRDVSALRARLADAPAPACLVAADTLGELLGRCEGKYRAMADKAQRHANDVRTLMEAWPR
jgi:hypothetical protein